MISDEEIARLPREPEAAFTELVRILWDRLQEDIANNQYTISFKVGFISDVLAAAEVYKIEALGGWQLPDPDDDELGQYFDRFSMAVNHFVTKSRLKMLAVPNAYTVSLDASAKRKIHHFVQQIRDTIEASALPVDKHDSLLAKLDDFAKEVDRNRTGLQQFAAVTVGVAAVIGEGFDKLEPARRWLDSAANLLGAAKAAEEGPQKILAPKPRPRLAPPKKPKKSRAEELDEEIPF